VDCAVLSLNEKSSEISKLTRELDCKVRDVGFARQGLWGINEEWCLVGRRELGYRERFEVTNLGKRFGCVSSATWASPSLPS
jgi:hypothetical protein